MANQKCESPLPEDIIHFIQSLMNEKTAARSAVLSKSWYGVWSTRTELCFNESNFGGRIDEFSEFTKKTLQRYEDRDQKIKALRLRMEGNQSLATELILKAIKLGVMNLTVESRYSSAAPIVLPEEVLESETLARLSVHRVTFDFRKRDKVVACSNLESLELLNPVVTDGEIVRDLLLRCPSIEELTLDDPLYFYRDKIGLKLKYLNLIDDLWPKFPFLKKLVICNGDLDHDWDGVRICSPSLEHISIYLSRNTIENAEFDVPNIRKFEFAGYHVPRLEIKTSSRKWESDIRIKGTPVEASVSWFSSLNMLVKTLSPSCVSLSIYVSQSSDNSTRFLGDGDGDGSRIPAVENLMLRGHARAVTPAFLGNLFLSCRPNFIDIEQENVELVQKFRSLPWMTSLDASTCIGKLVRFQLK